MPRSTPEPYIVRSVVHASQILGAFQSSAEVLRLRDVVQRTGFGKGMCFRLLHTLHHCGLLEKVDASRFRLISEIRRRKRYRLGYAGQGQDTSFAREVHASLQRAAEPEDVELIVVNNRYQPKVALRNAEHLVREHVDLVIEFQTDESPAPRTSGPTTTRPGCWRDTISGNGPAADGTSRSRRCCCWSWPAPDPSCTRA